MIPVIYALYVTKQKMYTRLFMKLAELYPTTIMVDFKEVSLKALTVNFYQWCMLLIPSKSVLVVQNPELHINR